jgi:hypothetical protein
MGVVDFETIAGVCARTAKEPIQVRGGTVTNVSLSLCVLSSCIVHGSDSVDRQMR